MLDPQLLQVRHVVPAVAPSVVAVAGGHDPAVVDHLLQCLDRIAGTHVPFGARGLRLTSAFQRLEQHVQLQRLSQIAIKPTRQRLLLLVRLERKEIRALLQRSERLASICLLSAGIAIDLRPPHLKQTRV